jgi:ribosomal protein S18 acetylase RimI-like enzyme
MTTTLPFPGPPSSSDPTVHVRRGRTEETPRLARVLARAFEHDPVSAFILPDLSRRRRGIEAMYRLAYVPEALKDNECYTTSDQACVALWAPAGKPRPGLGENLRLAPTMLRILGRHTPRALRVLHYMESQIPMEPHAHLLFLGTDPDRQGQGLGSVLLRNTLSQLDRARTPAYLEASTPGSRALYLRHGFTVMDEIRLPGGGPPLWRMWRTPGNDAPPTTTHPRPRHMENS